MLLQRRRLLQQRGVGRRREGSRRRRGRRRRPLGVQLTHQVLPRDRSMVSSGSDELFLRPNG